MLYSLPETLFPPLNDSDPSLDGDHLLSFHMDDLGTPLRTSPILTISPIAYTSTLYFGDRVSHSPGWPQVYYIAEG